MPLLGGELQWPLLHNPQHFQQPQKDFPQLLVQILAGLRRSPPARCLGFFPIFFFFVLVLQINVYHSLKQLLDAAARE